MKKFFLILTIFLIILSCRKSTVKTIVSPAFELNKDSVTPESLVNQILKDDEYKKWKFWPGHEGFNPGLTPHGKFHKIFVNDVIINALPIKDKIVPANGVIVKENYNADKELLMLTIMAKVKDYNPQAGDWLWATYSFSDKSIGGGKIDKCINCHAAVKNNDYVIIQALDKETEKNTY